MNDAKIPKPAEAHCATCSCAPGMTPAVRFDTTPAERDGVVRDHLIHMGWTPPACKSRVEQVAQEVLAEHEGDEAFDFLKAVVSKIVTRVTK